MIYFCIPARDEDRTIGVLLWKIRRVMAEFGRDYTILVLDDASSDETPEVLERYRPHLPLEILRNRERLGQGASLERLLRATVGRAPYPKRDVAVTLQGDFTEDPQDVVEMIKVLEGGADIVAGAEGDPVGPAPRRIRFARWAVPYLLGSTHARAPVSDPLCGFRAYRIIVLKKAFREVDPEPLLLREGWAAHVELLEKTLPHARRVEETPLRLRYDIRPRETRFRPLETLKELAPLRGRPWVAGGAT